MTETVDLAFLGQPLEKTLARVTNAEKLAMQNIEYSRRLERRLGEMGQRIDELKDDMELIMKAELTGRLGNFEIRMERLVADAKDEVNARLDKIEGALSKLLEQKSPRKGR